MAGGLSRRDLLKGHAKREIPLMLPPGAVNRFSRLCDGCGACAEACPTGIIRRGTPPVVDFSRGACTFCGDCIAACTTGALKPEGLPDWPWRGVIGSTCLSLQGVTCRACEDSCDLRAISFRLMTGGRSAPVLDQSQCSGCGECAFTCPATAIRFEQVAIPEKETLQ